MMYGSWDMEHDGHNFLSFWTIFCPFTPLTPQKMKISKKWKKQLEMSSFYTSVPKIMIISYTVLEIWHMTDVIAIFHFGLFSAFLPPQQTKKSKFLKNEKNSWRYHHFTIVYQKLWLVDVRFLRYGCVRRMDRQTDGREKMTYRGGCPTLK